jgi:hypothetical protein
MASLTTRPVDNASPEPELPSPDSDGFKKASHRTLQARALVRPRDDDEANSLDLDGLQVSSVEEWEEGEDEETSRVNDQGGQRGESKSSDIPGGHRMQASTSLADFKHVDEAINHAVDKNITLPQAFQQLAYRNSQVLIVNEGVLLEKAASVPFATRIDPPVEAAEPARGKYVSCIPPRSASSSKKKSSAVEAPPPKDISAPSAIKHKMHVQFNPEFCRYDGLSEAAAKSSANQQFGVTLSSVPKCAIDGYESKIPAILLLLWRKVLECQGEQSVGIFRLAADADEMNWLKKQINTGQYDGDTIEENIAATLIKIFFRQLPTNLLNHIDRKVIDQIADYNDMLTSPNREIAETIFHQLRDGLQEPQNSLLMWLLDTMGQVVAHKDINKMSAKNMAIVIAPNLYSLMDLSDPMAAITWTQRIARFAEIVLVARMQVRPPIVGASK